VASGGVKGEGWGEKSRESRQKRMDKKSGESSHGRKGGPLRYGAGVALKHTLCQKVDLAEKRDQLK